MGELFEGLEVKVRADFAETVADFYTVLVRKGLGQDVATALTASYLSAWFNSLALLNMNHEKPAN